VLSNPAARDGADSEAGWLLYHSVGRFPGQQAAIRAALGEAAEVWCAPDDRRWGMLHAAREAFFAAIARLIDAPAGTTFAAENVTQAFALFIDALPASQLCGRNVLIAADCFPSLHYLLAGLAERIGFRLVTVPPLPGRDSVEDEAMLAAWDEQVALGIVTWVTSTASHRADLAALAAHGRRMGSLVAVDATQGLGIIPFDAQALGIDFAASTSLKWLCGVPGAGFGYVRQGLLAETAPRLRGWFGKPDPFDWSLNSFRYAGDARRFDTGTPSYLPYVGSLPGIEWLLRAGVDGLRTANLAASERLIAVADAHRLAVASPRAAAQRGGSVMLGLPASLSAASVVQALAERGITADHRGQRLRLSPGPSTGADIADRLDRALATITRPDGGR
jgi:selenocysteine lyase/cysteine desulfurase